MSDVRTRMSRAHEEWLAETFDGVRSPGSGNHPANPADGRQDHRKRRIAFAWDGKATIASSITVKLSDWRKIQEQALGERPMLPLRLYLNDRLTEFVDLCVVSPDDLLELMFLAEGAQ